MRNLLKWSVNEENEENSIYLGSSADQLQQPLSVPSEGIQIPLVGTAWLLISSCTWLWNPPVIETQHKINNEKTKIYLGQLLELLLCIFADLHCKLLIVLRINFGKGRG